MKSKMDTANQPEVEIHLFLKGRPSPTHIFRSALGGWDRDRLEVQEILDDHNLQSLHSFDPSTGRGNPVRFSSRDGRSFDRYGNGDILFLHGEAKDESWAVPIVFAVAAVIVAVVAVVLVVEGPKWVERSRLANGKMPPWIIACLIIVFTAMRNRY